MCLAAVESVQLTRTGHGIFFSALWFHPVAGEGHRCGWWGEEQSGRPFPPPPPPAENYLRPASRWGFAVSRYTRGARTPARGARVRVRSNFTCNFAVEGGPRRMAGFLIISSCSRPGAILTGNNSTYGNSAIDIAGRRSICRSIETKQKWKLPASRVGHPFSLSALVEYRANPPTKCSENNNLESTRTWISKRGWG